MCVCVFFFIYIFCIGSSVLVDIWYFSTEVRLIMIVHFLWFINIIMEIEVVLTLRVIFLSFVADSFYFTKYLFIFFFKGCTWGALSYSRRGAFLQVASQNRTRIFQTIAGMLYRFSHSITIIKGDGQCFHPTFHNL